MPKKRGSFNGRQRGRGRRERRSRRPTRVVDPGLFYALRALVKLVLHLFAVRKLTPESEKALLTKLDTWYTEARDWRQTGVLVHPEGGPHRDVGPSEGQGQSVGKRSSRQERKPGRGLPSWPAEATLPSTVALVDEEEEVDGT